jgi:hypothetical protein
MLVDSPTCGGMNSHSSRNLIQNRITLPARRGLRKSIRSAYATDKSAQTGLVTTNRAFKEWHEVFPNAACVVSLVDRLVHNAEIVAIEGESYRLKEARDRTEARARKRRGTKS